VEFAVHPLAPATFFILVLDLTDLAPDVLRGCASMRNGL